jgi:hypothetical protein
LLEAQGVIGEKIDENAELEIEIEEAKTGHAKELEEKYGEVGYLTWQFDGEVSVETSPSSPELYLERNEELENCGLV